jgi:hypothetical protein
MAQCPSCSKNISISEENFGTLYRCEHCQAEFFIGFDGAPENSKEPVASEHTKSVVLPPVVNLEQKMTLDYSNNEVSNDAPNLYNIEPSGNDTETPNYLQVNQPEAQQAQPEPETAPPMMQPFQEPTHKQSSAFADFTKDVRDFGNEVSESGILTFDIEITGIDLGETKKELLEALDDARFGWNMDDINKSINDGKLILKDISAPKIIVLVKRITPIGLVLNWRHHVSTQ